MPFSDEWLAYNSDIDLFVPKEGYSAADRTRIDHPFSVTIQPDLHKPGSRPLDNLSSLGAAPGEPDWSLFIRILASWRVCRFHLAQAGTMSLVELRTIQDAVHDANGHLVHSVGETPAAPNVDLPVPSRIHIPISHDSSLERFDFLGHLAAIGHSVRALTILDPDVRELLPELGSQLAVRGIQRWTISPPFGSAETHWLLDRSDTEPPFITRLKEQFSWMHIEHACFPVREGNLIVQPDGALFTTDPVTAQRSFLGWLTKMSLAELLVNPAFNQTLHLTSWVSLPRTPARNVTLSLEPIADKSYPFDAFVSYNHDDWQEVKELASRLRIAGIRLWVDKWEIQPGTRWIPELDEIIGKIPVMLVVVGKTGNVESTNQKLEYDAFHHKFRRLIPVILASAPSKIDLPPSLDNYSRVELMQRDPDPFDQLLWGITGRKPHPSAE